MTRLRGTRSKYRSRLEERVANKLSDKWRYESESFNYVRHHIYNPDFSSDGIHLEVKGRFRTSGEASKYIAVREANPGIIIVFVFQSGSTPMPGTKRRSDGTKYTVSEWADRNGFLWTTEEGLTDEVLKKIVQTGHCSKPVKSTHRQTGTQVSGRGEVFGKGKRKVGKKATKPKRS